MALVSNNRDLIDFVSTPPFLRLHYRLPFFSLKSKHVYLLGTFFSYLGVLRSDLGARKAKLDNIRSIEHLLTNLWKNSLFW